jgi:nucleoside-diphosphate-sugar epimerase
MSISIPLNPSAREVFSSLLANRPRVLVIGATGWFGRTFVDLGSGLGMPSMLVGSSRSRLLLGQDDFQVVAWDHEMVAEFRPEVVFDFAFLLANRMTSMGRAAYVAANRSLVDRSEWLLSLDSVRDFYTVSSGAAVADSGREVSIDVSVYGSLKREAEARLSKAARTFGKRLRIVRAWSVSGGHVPRPQQYVFSDMIFSALHSGVIEIKASGPLLRRYCAVEDLLTVALADSSNEHVTVIESGGPLVEALELADAIASFVRGSTIIEHAEGRIEGPPNAYHSDGEDWVARLGHSALRPLSLDDQIHAVLESLRARATG